MARKVFFSFDFDRDAWRVSQVRNCDIVKSNYEKNKFLDAASWEQIRKQGDDVIKRWINSQMKGTSVTIVLIGRFTASRKWVKYEIIKSARENRGLMGIYIHRLKDKNKQKDSIGTNPFIVHWSDEKLWNTLDYMPETYDWVLDNGRHNIDTWIEDAAKQVGR